MKKNNNDKKLENFKAKYKLLADMHRKYLMQKNNEKIRNENFRAKVKETIFTLSNKILELSSDDELTKNNEFIKKAIKGAYENEKI